MKEGNWIPLDKGLVKALPRDRPYSYIEAMFSYTVDKDNNREGTISGYANLWEWNRKKVRKFIEDLGTGKGQVRDSKGTGKGHPIRFINNNLQDQRDSKGTGKGQEVGQVRDTTIYPNPNPKPKRDNINREQHEISFTEFWDIYPKRNGKKIGKASAKEKFFKLKNSDLANIIIAVTNYSRSKQVLDGYAKDAERFLKKDFWKDWMEGEESDDGMEWATDEDIKQEEERKRRYDESKRNAF